ncbi:MAG TPA: hypothetical protein VJ925_08075 [Longimicrobiales bacterium]|nr:hypothetical protein [Longimicrobiales bacterium]
MTEAAEPKPIAITNLLTGANAEEWRDDASEIELVYYLIRKYREVLAAGYGEWCLFEPGLHNIRHASGWNRPIEQAASLTPNQWFALETVWRLVGETVRKSAYIGTLAVENGQVVDVVPGLREPYLSELARWESLGADRVYFDATSWNAEQRPGWVGGGARRDGILELNEWCQKMGYRVRCGMEPIPRDGDRLRTDLGFGLCTGRWAVHKFRTREIDYSTLEHPDNLHIVIFNLHRDGADPERLAKIAAFGPTFGVGHTTARHANLLALVGKLNAIAAKARMLSQLPLRRWPTTERMLDQISARPSPLRSTNAPA